MIGHVFARRREVTIVRIDADSAITKRTRLAADISSRGGIVRERNRMSRIQAGNIDVVLASGNVVLRLAPTVACMRLTVIRYRYIIDGHAQQALLAILRGIRSVALDRGSDSRIPVDEVETIIRIDRRCRRRIGPLHLIRVDNLRKILIRQRTMLALQVGHGEVYAMIVKINLTLRGFLHNIFCHSNGRNIAVVMETERAVFTARLVILAKNGVTDPLDQSDRFVDVFRINRIALRIRSILIPVVNLNGMRLIRQILERDDILLRVGTEQQALHLGRRIILRAILRERRRSKNRHALGVSSRGSRILRLQHLVGILFDIPHRILNRSSRRISKGNDVLRRIKAELNGIAELVRTLAGHSNRVLGNRLARRERSVGDNLLAAHRYVLLIDITHLVGEGVHLPMRVQMNIRRDRHVHIEHGFGTVIVVHIPAKEGIAGSHRRLEVIDRLSLGDRLRTCAVGAVHVVQRHRLLRRRELRIEHKVRSRHLIKRISCRAFRVNKPARKAKLTVYAKRSFVRSPIVLRSTDVLIETNTALRIQFR